MPALASTEVTLADSRAVTRFDARAANYVASEIHAGSPTIARLHELVAFLGAGRVCDVACGPGHTALSFAGQAARIVGVDPAPRMLAAFRELAATRRVAVEPVRARAESLPLAGLSFDLTVSRLAPHHFSDIGAAVREMARVTRVGGAVAIIDLEGDPDPACAALNHEIELLHDPTHVRSYTAGDWSELFRAAGLAVTALERRHAERPDGVPVQRWCEIAGSGPAAEREIRRRLNAAPPAMLATLGIRRDGEEFVMPTRTVLVIGRVSAD